MLAALVLAGPRAWGGQHDHHREAREALAIPGRHPGKLPGRLGPDRRRVAARRPSPARRVHEADPAPRADDRGGRPDRRRGDRRAPACATPPVPASFSREPAPRSPPLLGVCAGAADITAGVFRGLVTTGRSRVALFLARVPAGLALSVAFTLAGYLIVLAGSALFAGHPPAAPGGLARHRWRGVPARPGSRLARRRDLADGQPGRLAPGAARHWGVARDRAWRCSAKYALDRRSHKNTITARPTPHSARPMIQVGPVSSPWSVGLGHGQAVEAEEDRGPDPHARPAPPGPPGHGEPHADADQRRR